MRATSFVLGIALACIGIALALPIGAHAHGVTLELHHPWPEASPVHTAFFVPWTEKIAKESGGRLHIRLHAGAGPEGGNLYEQVRGGDIDAAWTVIDPTPDRFPALRPFAMPFATHGTVGATYGLMDFIRVNDLRERDFDGVRLIAAHVGDATQLHADKDVGSAPEGWRGKRIAVATAADAAAIHALGGVPIKSAFPDLLEPLKRGALDGALLPWSAARTAGVDALARHHVEFGSEGAGLSRPICVLIVSPESFRGLADDLKIVLDANSGPDTAAWLARSLDEAAVAARSAAVDRGDALVVPTPAELERWRAMAAPLAEKSAPPALLDRAREALGRHDPGR